MQRTNIDYLTHTWNPLAMRCTRMSNGCDNCWHLSMANRMAYNPKITMEEREAYTGEMIPLLRTKELSEPFSKKQPCVIGVQFMGDLFHDSVTNEQIAAIFGVIAACPQHTFLVLTKRPGRAMKWFEWLENMSHSPNDHEYETYLEIGAIFKKPLPNLWIGTSVENQKTADDRVTLLLQIPAAHHYVSFEPGLNEIEFQFERGWLEPFVDVTPSLEKTPRINLLIMGAETGPHKRLMNLDWARSVRDQCAAAEVPFWFKKDSDGKQTLDGVEHHPEFWK